MIDIFDDIPSLQAIARGRNRKQALGVIIPRIKELKTEGRTEVDGIDLMFSAHPDGGPTIYFRASEDEKILMTGWLNDFGEVLIINGQTVVVANDNSVNVLIMTWKRGQWEARLFK